MVRGLKITLLLMMVAQLSLLAQEKPNILLIMADDQANRTISAYGAGINSTPAIDRIATEGAIFNNSYCANSICQPSRAAILTGKHSHKNGVYGNGYNYDNTQQQLPGILQDNGYATAVIGKWHLKGEDPGSYFDYWKILTEGGGQGYYYNPTFIEHTGSTVQVEGYSTDVITDLSLDWLDNNKDSGPFCLMVHYKAPHVTRMPMLRNLTLYDDVDIPEPATLYDDYSTRESYASSGYNKLRYDIEKTAYNYFPAYGTYTLADYALLERMTEEQRLAYHAYYDEKNQEYDDLVAAGTVVPGEVSGKAFAYQRFIKDYLKVVAGVDQNVERILDYLDDNSLASNTIVIYCSDQSYFTGQHGYYEKRFMYEDGMKMPLLMRYPDHIQSGTKVDEFVQNIDFAPTLLEYVDVDVPEDMQGESFKDVVEGNVPEDWRESVYYHYYDHGKHGIPRHEGVKTYRYKLINFYTDDAWELYDLQNDPNEINNIYNEASNKELIASLKLELATLRNQYEVPGSEKHAEDFEGGDYWDNQANLNWVLATEGASDLSIVPNPLVDDTNTTANVGEIILSEELNPVSLQVNLADEFWDFTTNRYATLKLKTALATKVGIRLSFNGENEYVKWIETQGLDVWVNYKFDLTNILDGNLQNTYNQLELVFGSADNPVAGAILFDELEFTDNVTTALRQIQGNDGFVYPNPTCETVYFNFDNVSKVEVFDIEGSLKLAEQGANMKSVSLAALKDGFYLLRLSTGNKKIVRKVKKVS